MAVKILSQREALGMTHFRKGESKLGEKLRYLNEFTESELLLAKSHGVKYAILGIPESIGVMGNHGRGGTENAWEAFLKSFLNVQANRFIKEESILVVGNLDLEFLQKKAQSLDSSANYYIQKLHLLCEEVDEMVLPAVDAICKVGLIPIVIGGGHNNAYPIIGGASKAKETMLNVINLDAHADFRPLEGRHSGNPFSYAMQARALDKYAVFGLHENYNNEHMLKALDSLASIHYKFLEGLNYFGKDLQQSIDFVSGEVPVGIELDMDAIKLMPSSAISPTGFSLEQARNYLKLTASQLDVAYVHLPEAAPIDEYQERMVGKALTYLVTDLIKAHKKRG